MSREAQPNDSASVETTYSPAVIERAQEIMDSLERDYDDMQRLAYTSWTASTQIHAAGDELEKAYAIANGPHTSATFGATAEAMAYSDAAIDYNLRKKAGQLTDEEHAVEIAMTTLYPKGLASIEENKWNKMLRKHMPATIAYHEAASGKRVFKTEEAFQARVAEIAVLQADLEK